MASRAVGIDLGTTYSAIAVVNEHGDPEIIPNADGERITPSAIFFDDETVVVGQTAKDHAGTEPDRVVMFIKRQIGNPHWFFQYRQRRLSPIDLSAMVVAKLKKDAESLLGDIIERAIITVPAYFDDAHRRATIAAGQMAGLEVLDVINEPTAAAVAFGATRSGLNEHVLIYDLGGGTFDVTILHVDNQKIKVSATGGNHQLGGKDFDDAVISWAADRFQAEHGFDPTNDKTLAAEIRQQAEKAKRELSKRLKTTLVIRAADGKTTRAELSREDFERLIRPKVDSTLSLVRVTLADAKLTPPQIDRVLLVGGSTRVPLIRAVLRDFFGKEPDTSINPDEAVALGAAISAAQHDLQHAPEQVPTSVADKVGGLQITDVTSHSFGIEAAVPGSQQKINSILIPRNSPLPTEVAREFVTTLPGQTVIKFTIYQGEFRDPQLCNPIGDFVLAGLPAGRQAGKKVRVTFTCDTNGVVHVSAVDIETGRQAETQVSYRVGATTQEVANTGSWLNTVSIE